MLSVKCFVVTLCTAMSITIHNAIIIPNTPTTPSTPINPINPPYPDRKGPLDMIAVMYGVMSTPYTAIDGINTINSSKDTTAFTNKTEIKD